MSRERGRHAAPWWRSWWPTIAAIVLVALVLGGRWWAGRPRTVELGTPVATAGLRVTVSEWRDAVGLPADDGDPPPPGTELGAATIESCRTAEGGQLADLSRFRVEVPDADAIDPFGSRLEVPDDDCVGGEVLFAVPEGRRPTAVVFEGSPPVRWLVAER